MKQAAALSSAAPAGASHPIDFEECYDAHAALVTRWVSRLGGVAMDVDDVVQEVFCVVHRKLPQWDGQGTLTTWLFRITHHVVRNWNRKQRFCRWLGLGDNSTTADDMQSDSPGPVEQMESHQAARDVRRALAELTEKHRTLIVLFELEELSTPEIAEMLDVKVGTVRVGLHRARSEFLQVYERLQTMNVLHRGGNA